MGDFNSILFEYEKVGGSGPNKRAMHDFASCLESCNLMEIQSKGPFLTWQRASWLAHPDFKEQVIKLWLPHRDCGQNLLQFQENIREWNHLVFGNIFNQKRKILSRLEGLDRKLLEGPNQFLSNLRDSFPHLDPQVLSPLSYTPTINEVKAALFEIGNFKSPGPDGIHAILYKSHWEVMHPSIMKLILQPLSNYVLQPIPPDLVNLTVAGATLNGHWNLQILNTILPQDIIQRLFAIIPPRQYRDDDIPTWSDSCDGQFHLKGIYGKIAAAANNDMDTDLWQFVWKWNGPPRIKCFLWKCLHGKLPTNEERIHRGMAGDSS
ncbi:Reverse transcriptase zinc-binding domain [Sesbania bispinosa]|nr:Reverse transcriptase zinc-binding domain [Sesbania bispinosa]